MAKGLAEILSSRGEGPVAEIIIAGSGFAGLTTALQLKRHLGNRTDHHITVIAKDDQFLYRPALIPVAFGTKSLSDIQFRLSPVYRRAGIEFFASEIVDIDPKTHTVATRERRFPYDKLVVALGEHLAYDEIPGLKEYGYTVCSQQGAQALADALPRFTGGPAVVGWAQYAQTGGPSFEVALELHHYMKRRQLPGSISFVDPLPKFWAPAGEKASSYLERLFATLQIPRYGPVQIQEVSPDRVILADGRELPSQLTIITPPFRGQPAQSGLAAGQPRNWIETGKDMRSLRYPDIYVAGNATAFDGPKQGHTAMLQAEVAAHNLALDLLARPGERRQYDHEMSCVLDLGQGQGLFVRRSLWNTRHQVVKLGRRWPLAKSLLEYTFVHTPVFKQWGVPISRLTR